MDSSVSGAIAILALAGAATFASCDGSPPSVGGGGGSAAPSAGAAGSVTGGGGSSGGGGGGGAPLMRGVVPFDPVWSKATPAEWEPYPIPDTPCDGCAYMNPDGVLRLVDSVRAQRADGKWSVFPSGAVEGQPDKAAWAIDLEARVAYRVDDGCGGGRAAGGGYCGGGIPSVDSGIMAFGSSASRSQAVFVRNLATGETKQVWKTTTLIGKDGFPTTPSLLATGMAYPYAYWVEAGIYRLDLRNGHVVAHPACDGIEAVTVARNGLACCDRYGQGAAVIDFDHDVVDLFPASKPGEDRVGIHSYLSRDGTELVWAEHPAGARETDRYRIVYRNLVSGEERVVAESDDVTVKRNDYPVVEGGVVLWSREMVTPEPIGYLWTTGYWKVGDAAPSTWDRMLFQFRPTPYGLLAAGFTDNVPNLPAPNLLFPYPEGYRPSTMPPPGGGN